MNEENKDTSKGVECILDSNGITHVVVTYCDGIL